MPTFLITGAGGQVGQELQRLSAGRSERFLFADSRSLDISDAAAVRAYFAEHRPTYCINCAAYTAVDRAEAEPERAFAVNRDGAANLARACAEQGSQLLHYSSDYVYHNDLNRPLRETDPTNPQGVYAASKLAGERAIGELLPDALILRTSWVYSSYGHNFVKTMLRLGRERPELRIVYDQIGTPTYARDLAAASLQLLAAPPAGGGVYNFANEGVTSWYDFALATFELAGITACRVVPIESADYPTPARRPHYSVLNKSRIKQAFGLRLPHWREALGRCLHDLPEPQG